MREIRDVGLAVGDVLRSDALVGVPLRNLPAELVDAAVELARLAHAIDARAVRELDDAGGLRVAQVEIENPHGLEVVRGLDDEHVADALGRRGLRVLVPARAARADEDREELGHLVRDALRLPASDRGKDDEHLRAFLRQRRGGFLHRPCSGSRRDAFERLRGVLGLVGRGDADDANLHLADGQEGRLRRGLHAGHVRSEERRAARVAELRELVDAAGEAVARGREARELERLHRDRDGLGLGDLLTLAIVGELHVHEEERAGRDRRVGGRVLLLRGDERAEVVHATELILDAPAGLQRSCEVGHEVEPGIRQRHRGRAITVDGSRGFAALTCGKQCNAREDTRKKKGQAGRSHRRRAYQRSKAAFTHS